LDKYQTLLTMAKKLTASEIKKLKADKGVLVSTNTVVTK
jgi:hypothetical protein